MSASSKNYKNHTGLGGTFDCNIGRILRSSHPSCCLWVAVGPVGPVVPGDRRVGLLVPLEMHPGCVSGRLTWLRSLLISSGGPGALPQPRPPGRPSALTTVSMGYVRLPGTRFGPSAGGFVGGRVRGTDVGELGKTRRLVRCSNGVAPHRGLRDQHERRR